MTDFKDQRLILLLTQPRESLSLEYKSWLDLSTNHGKATIAKAAIALANSGGGTIVLGMREDESDKAIPESKPKPNNIARYDAAKVNAAINRFADPKLDCEVVFAIHPDTNEEHAFVVIPSNVSVPVMSTRDSGDDIKQQTCYIRKPGPKSEPPYTSEEWRTLLDRCVRSSRKDMLDSIRTIVLGGPESLPARQSDSQRLHEFISASRERWEELVKGLPAEDPARFLHGSFEVAFSLTDRDTSPSLRELRDLLRDGPAATRGWPPFIALSREPYTEKVIGGAIECWLGDPEGDRTFHSAYFSPFWRAHPNGYFYQIEGYYEPERFQSMLPGTPHYPEFAVQRLAHFLLHAHDLAERFGGSSDILLACMFTGLKDKILVGTPRRPIFQHYACHDEDFSFETRVSQMQITDNLLEIIHQHLSQLYEQFSFFELTKQSVANYLDELAT